MLFTIFIFLVVLGILVLVHEAGHFLAAKSIGVRVDKFSIGFWPKLFGIKWGETEYMISLVPWGGYVKIAGQEEPEGDEPQHHELCSRSKLERLFVFCAGPLANFVLALALFPVVYMMGITVYEHIDQPARVGWVQKDSPAMRAGITSGDLIVQVEGTPTPTWEDAMMEIGTRPDQRISVLIDRSGQKKMMKLIAEQDPQYGAGVIGVGPPIPPIVYGVSPTEPADRAGLKDGDVVLSINGEAISDWMQTRDAIRASGGKPLQFEVRRGKELIRCEVVPRFNDELGCYVIGMVAPPYPTKVVEFPFPVAMYKGAERAFDTTGQTLALLYKLVSGQASIKSLGGPIMIAQVSGTTARAGATPLLQLIAFLSIQLFILNLLPIPILDGGHVLFLGVETAIKRPVSLRVKEIASRVFFVALITLMLFVSYNDILRLLR